MQFTIPYDITKAARSSRSGSESPSLRLRLCLHISERRFYNNVDNTTWGELYFYVLTLSMTINTGNVTYLSSAASSSQGLTYVDQATGRAIVKVDNTTNVPGPSDQVPFIHRNSVRLIRVQNEDWVDPYRFGLRRWIHMILAA